MFNLQYFGVFPLSRLTWYRDELLGVGCLDYDFGHFLLKFTFPSLLILNFKVLCQWMMDQVPLGNKTPRPGYARQIWCPACSGLLQYPLALNSGHVLVECMVVEGICFSFWRIFLPTVQVQESAKEFGLSSTNVLGLEGVRKLPTISM